MGLRRELGAFDATMVVVGGIIGAGIFINPYLVAERLPSGAWILAAWSFGGLVALAGAFAFAELAALYPTAGGEYAYLREAYHPAVAFLFGWASLVMIQGGGLAAVGVTFAQYGLRLAGASGDPRPLASGAVAVVALVNYAGVKPGSRLLNVLVLLKIGALAALILGGLFLFRGASAPPPVAATPLPSATVLAFGAALVPILFSYGGWQSANTLAEEIREPRRTLPRALFAGTLVVLAVYLLVNAVYLATLGRDGLAATATPAADAARRLFGGRVDRWLAAAIAISAFGFMNLTLLGPTRISYAMARDGVFFPGLARLHPRFGTPHRAILLQALWAIVLLWTGTYGGLVDSVVFADWIFFGLTVASVLLLRRRVPPEKRPPGAYLSPGYPVLPLLFLAACVLVLAGVVRSNPLRSGVGALLLLAGLPLYVAFSGRARAAGGTTP
ncbi:MAG TPA: amino acid permease [Thermoanaerobaculia bacterium]|nr:amino acid permease [Thermoanaerobaculia bacterium]